MDTNYKILLWFLACNLHGFIDVINFRRKRDSGFWSIKTGPCKLDAWHVGKFIMWSVITYLVFPDNVVLMLLAAWINMVVHEAILHGLAGKS